MKKIIALILSVIFFSGILLYAPFIDEKHDHNHEHSHNIFDTHIISAYSADCPNCSKSGPNSDKPLYGTVAGYVRQEATCTSEGVLYYICEAGCGYDGTEAIPKLSHSYSPWDTITPATCTGAGERIRICARCQNVVTESVPALGHNYVEKTNIEATCVQAGEKVSVCSRCNDSHSEINAALGHNYVEKITKAATCTQTGEIVSTCTRCNDSTKRTTKALGHDYQIENIEATCTEEGHNKKICKRCKDETDEIIAALGHDLDEGKIVKEASCLQDGLKQATCKRCGNTVDEKTDKLGHDYPDEWIIEKESGYFSEGLQSKKCSRCDSKVEEMIPRKSTTPIVTGGCVLAGLGGFVGFLAKKKAALKGVKAIKDTIEKPDLFKPSIEDKTIVLCSEDEKIIDLLKEKHYLSVTDCAFEELKDTVLENEPDLVFACIDDNEKLSEIINLKKEELSDYNMSLMIDKKVIDDNKDVLAQMVKDKQLINYLALDSNKYDVMIKLILPILKPKMNSDETLENIGGVADLLGIPFVSTVLDTYIAGRDIKATLQEEQLGISETSSIISNIASILGYDTIGDVTGLVGDIEDIKASLDKEAGANEAKGGIKASKDIVDVVGSLVDKD